MENCQKQAMLGDKIRRRSFETRASKEKEEKKTIFFSSFSYFLHLHRYHHFIRAYMLREDSIIERENFTLWKNYCGDFLSEYN